MLLQPWLDEWHIVPAAVLTTHKHWSVLMTFVCLINVTVWTVVTGDGICINYCDMIVVHGLHVAVVKYRPETVSSCFEKHENSWVKMCMNDEVALLITEVRQRKGGKR